MPLQKIPYSLIVQAIHGSEYIGYCLACGASQYDVEPDARLYICDECEQRQVYGAEEILIMDMVAMEGN